MKFLADLSQNTKFKRDLVIAGLTVLVPFGFYIYIIVPEDISFWSTKWFTIHTDYFEDVNYFFWLISVKVLTIAILSLWYLSCTYWWRSILVLPIVLEFYKVALNIYAEVFNEIGGFVVFVCSLLASVPFIILLNEVAKKLNYYKYEKIVRQTINNEINNQVQKLSNFKAKDYYIIRNEMKSLYKDKGLM